MRLVARDRDRPLDLTPATVLDWRERARRRLPRQMFDYIDGGAYEEQTMRANVADLGDVLLNQVVMRDVSVREQSSEVLGQSLSMPVILGPVGLAGMFATRAEVQAAEAAGNAGVPFVESTVSICGIEEVADAVAYPPWFQLYVMRDRSYAEGLIARAKAVGSPVLVLTVDLAVVGARHRDTRNAMVGEGHGRWAGVRRGLDLVGHPRWIADVAIKGKPLTFGNLEDAVPGARRPDDFKEWVDSQFDPAVTWEDVSWVRDHWEGPLVIKGILAPEDARRAADAGADAVIVSNHGGRQLDTVPGAAEVLPEVVEAIGDEATVMVDGGVRRGTDVAKALILGADFALVGRPVLWGLATGGAAGVEAVLGLLADEFDRSLALLGVPSARDLRGRSDLLG